MKIKRPEQVEKPWFYVEFLRELGVSTPELQELFAQEVQNLSHEEMLVIRDGNCVAPDTYTPADLRDPEALLCEILSTRRRNDKRIYWAAYRGKSGLKPHLVNR